jgi:hypothetical protein
MSVEFGGLDIHGQGLTQIDAGSYTTMNTKEATFSLL